MMKNSAASNPPIDGQREQVLDGVHGGHVDHDLGVWRELSGVEYVQITVVQCHYPNITEV